MEKPEYKTYIEKINSNAEKVIDLLADMDLNLEDGQRVLKKAINFLEKVSLKTKIKAIHQKRDLW